VSPGGVPGIGGTLRDPPVVVILELGDDLAAIANRGVRAVVGRGTEDGVESPHPLSRTCFLDQLQRRGTVPLVAAGDRTVAPLDDARLVDHSEPVEHGCLARLPRFDDRALQQAIDPDSLRLSIPKFEGFDPVVEDAHFIADNGHLAAEVVVTAAVSPAAVLTVVPRLTALLGRP